MFKSDISLSEFDPEISAAIEVLNSGVLSDFLGCDGEKFKGGKYVKRFEEEVCNYFLI